VRRWAAEDPEVAAHLRTCLRCFRTASELREVPQLAGLLRQAQEDDQPDPGDLFWARFPATVADAWERRRREAGTPAVSPVRRLGALFRRPVPAALAGAAVAAALVLALIPRGQRPQAGLPAAPAVAVAPAEPVLAPEEEHPATLLGEEDPLDVLDLADTRVVARLTAAEADRGVGLGISEELGDVDGERSQQPLILPRISVQYAGVFVRRVSAFRAHANRNPAPQTFVLVAGAPKAAVACDLIHQRAEARIVTVRHVASQPVAAWRSA